MNSFRYIKLAAIFAAASISAQLEYRLNFVINAMSSLLTAGSALFGLRVLAGEGTVVGGWSYREAMIVVGLFTLVQGFIGTLLYPNLNKIAEAVRLGTMDFHLLKPIDAQFLVSTRNINIFHVVDICVGAGVTIWALRGLETSPSSLLTGGLLIIAALAIVYAIWFGLSTTAFWFVRVENITELFNGLFRAGQFPVSVFPGWVRLFFTFVVPVAFITTVPAEALLGRLTPRNGVVALGVALALLLAARAFWRRAIRSYTSASS
ncbi:ABC transporter permease [Kallotenue papyrolyticum]|uniref:ABC transporter permease n=1 Tax=Kallotenue papyrolyticum TaxID=1325125 RepID=UPI0004927207|nr:ABC-2 family transporter protein [Kallotenue papyrolyticum]